MTSKRSRVIVLSVYVVIALTVVAIGIGEMGFRLRWDSGIIRNVDYGNGTVRVLTDGGEMVDLPYPYIGHKALVIGQHIEYRTYDGRLLDFWYDWENVELRK